MSVELVAEPRDLSLMRREADLALRFGRPWTESRLISRKLCDLTYAVYVGEGADAHDLPWISYEAQMDALPQAE